MVECGIRSTYSQCPFEIRMHDEDGLISTGTAFFYQHDRSWFIITNWHNLSGRNFLTKEPLSVRFPTFIEANLSSYEVPGHQIPPGHFTTVSRRVDIYRNYQPVWYEHPVLGSSCDVVAIPFERPSACPEFMHNAANCVSRTRIPVKPGVTCFVIGFPYSLSIGFGLPIWKSGFIASEPYYDICIGGQTASIGGSRGGAKLPAFFLDTQTRQGMSGAPVFASYVGTWNMTDPYREVDPESEGFWDRNDVAMGASAMEFVGCYSGRIGKVEEGAALGLCWRADVIKLICESRSAAKHPHFSSSE